MKRAPVRVRAALLGVLLLGLLLQWAAFLPVFGQAGVALWVLLGVALAGCLAFGWRSLGWALSPIAAQDAELRQLLSELMAEGELPRPPRVARAVPPSAPGLYEMEQLGRRLQARLGERRELERQLEEARAYKQGFLKAVRHELRTPLNSILGFAEVLLSDLEGPLTSGQRENLVVILRTGKRLQDLFDEVIELASVSAARRDLRREAIDAPALLEQVGEALEEERGDRPVHIRIAAGDAVPQVAGDPVRLRQLLRGIASHALSVSTGELIVLSARAANGHVILTVSDPARRLSAADVTQLLARESAVSRRKGLDEGSRLRLAIWQELAALYGGQLSLHSDAGGTELQLTLPVWSAP